MKHMTDNNLFSDSQYGFRNKRSCVLRLLEVLDYWNKSVDEGKLVDTIYFDIRKAFDSISHRRLLQKLEAYGIEGEVLEWVRYFLKGRYQRAMQNRKSSDWMNVTSGVPQGYVLGPVLFIIYFKDMLRKYCKMFADDAKLYSAIATSDDQTELLDDLFDSWEWGKDWLLEHNIHFYKFSEKKKTTTKKQRDYMSKSCWSLLQLAYFVYVRNESPGDGMHTCRLVGAFATRRCNKNHHRVC